jgi:hypothetical protein
MSPKISEMECKINQMRLDLIRIIAEINRTLSTQAKATRSEAYKSLKAEYQKKQEEIYYLRVLIKEMGNNNSLAA